jgi:ribosomal protein S18 acetylase RimI-like enzyme
VSEHPHAAGAKLEPHDADVRHAPPAMADGRSPIPGAHHPPPAISRVRWRELAAVARLQERAFRPGLAYRLSTLIMLRSLPWVRFFVARRGGAISGCVIGDWHEGNSRIVNIAVDPVFRRQGVATALLAAIEFSLPEGDMILMVEADNPAAQALYDRCGYVQTGPARDYYGIGRDGIWMRKPRPGGVPKVRV